MLITSMGELLVDFTPAGKSENQNNLYEANCGGACANVAVAVARLGQAAAGLSTTGKGAIPAMPSLRDVEAILAK